MIDIKTLHIGSHVLVNGKRERVRGLDEDNALVNGIWLYECYDNPFHKRVIGFERYIDSIGDVVLFLNHFAPRQAKAAITKLKEG